MEQNKTLMMPLKLLVSVSARAHELLSNLHRAKTHVSVPNGANNKNSVMYI